MAPEQDIFLSAAAGDLLYSAGVFFARKCISTMAGNFTHKYRVRYLYAFESLAKLRAKTIADPHLYFLVLFWTFISHTTHRFHRSIYITRYFGGDLSA